MRIPWTAQRHHSACGTIHRSRCSERPAVLGNKEGHVAGRGRGNESGDLGVNGDRQDSPGFLLPHRQHAISDMLTTHADHVGSTLRRIQPQRER